MPKYIKGGILLAPRFKLLADHVTVSLSSALFLNMWKILATFDIKYLGYFWAIFDL